MPQNTALLCLQLYILLRVQLELLRELSGKIIMCQRVGHFLQRYLPTYKFQHAMAAQDVVLSHSIYLTPHISLHYLTPYILLHISHSIYLTPYISPPASVDLCTTPASQQAVCRLSNAGEAPGTLYKFKLQVTAAEILYCTCLAHFPCLAHCLPLRSAAPLSCKSPLPCARHSAAAGCSICG